MQQILKIMKIKPKRATIRDKTINTKPKIQRLTTNAYKRPLVLGLAGVVTASAPAQGRLLYGENTNTIPKQLPAPYQTYTKTIPILYQR